MAARGRNGGRKPFVPTDEQRKLVSTMSAMGLSHDQICVFLPMKSGKPMSRSTLIRHFRAELDHGALKATVKVAQNLFSIATSQEAGAVTAAIFWLKTRGGDAWREKTKLEVSGADGGPIKTEAVTVEQVLEARQELLDGEEY
jgi:hypothetical protein